MTTVAPPPPPLPNPPPMASQAVAVAVNPPPSLAGLGVGALLKGTAVQIDPKGAVQLQTPVGALTIHTALAPPLGAVLALQIQAIYPQVQLQILSMDGEALRRFASPQAMTKGMSQPGDAALAETSLPLAVNLTAGAQAVATVIRPPQGQFWGPAPSPGQVPFASSPAGIFPAPGNQPLPGAGEAPPTVMPGRHVQGPQAAALLDSVSQAAAKAPPAAPSFTNAPIGTQVTIKVVSIQPPGQPLPQPLSMGVSLPFSPPPGLNALAVGQTLDAVVTGATAAGNSIVMTAAGEMSLSARAPLPEGAILILQVTGKPVFPPAPPALSINEPGAGMFLARGWPALGEAAQALSEADASVIQNLINNVIPKPDSHLAANILFFMMALRSGNLSGWLGEEADKILTRVKPSLAARMKEDFNALARMAGEPAAAGGWRIALVPFFNGTEFEQIRMMTRRHGKEGGEEEDRQSIRFVIDVVLSCFGRLQLDGLLRDKGKHMELLVRTGSHLPSQIQNGIRDIFRETSELTGVKGGVGFQASPPNFVEAAVKEIAGGGVDGLVV